MTIEMPGAEVPMAVEQAETTLNVLQKNSKSRNQEQPVPPSLYPASGRIYQAGIKPDTTFHSSGKTLKFTIIKHEHTHTTSKTTM